jgi:excisionase family DNA binding protein
MTRAQPGKRSATAEKEFLTTGEVAAMCGLARSTIRRAVAHGRLAAWHTPGMFLRFSRSACLEFAESLERIDAVGPSDHRPPAARQNGDGGKG